MKTTFHSYTINVNLEYFIKQLKYKNNIALIYYQSKLGVFYQSAEYMKTTLHSYTININSEYFINQLIYETNIALIYYQFKLGVFYQSAKI